MLNNSFTSQSLAILLWNANGLANHRNELITSLNEKRIDIAFISETHFTSNSKCSFPGYNTFSSCHPDNTAHGGAAIIIRSSLQFTAAPPVNNDFLQAAIVNINLNHVPITVAAAYCPPKHKITPSQFDSFFNSLGRYFIVGGDLNAKNQTWGCHSTNPKGHSLFQSITSNHLTILNPPNPTYWPTSTRKRPDILDIFVTKIPTNLNHLIKNLLDPSSDHTPVFLSLDGHPSSKPNKACLTNNSTNWTKFREIINSKINLNISLKTPNEVEDAVQNFTESIQSAAWNSSTIQNYHANSHSTPTHVRELITQKRRARARWQRTRLPSDKNLLNNLTSSLKRMLSKIRNESFNNWTSSLTAESGSLWRATRSCLKQKTAQAPLKNSNGNWCKTDKEQADAFCSHLSKVFQPHNDINNNLLDTNIENSLFSPLPLYLAPKPFSPNEVQYYIKSFPLKKSPGIDLITAEVARQLPKKAIIHLTHILNSILRLSYMPLQWKVSVIILFPKPGKPPDITSSYRPISLLPFFSKLCEKLIIKRISQLVNDKNIIPHTQFGFRNKHSTIHQIHRLTDAIAYSFENKLYCSAVLLDVAQAFDKVWHTGLLYKLKQFLPPPYFLFFKSYLENRHFVTKVGSEFSNLAPILAGVPQGAISSPILYNIYAADQPISPNTSVAEFADDKIIFTSNENPLVASQHLQKHLNDMEVWYSNWKIKINNEKSSHITFTLRQGVVPPVSLANKIIPSATKVKYLGLLLDKRLTWAEHIKQKRLLLNSRRKSLYPLLGKQSKLNLKNKLLLYKTLLKPIWAYGIQLWGTAKKSNIYKMQTFQSITLRIITNAPFYVTNHTLHSDLGLPTVAEVATSSYKRYRSRLTNHPNPLILALNSTNIPGNPPRRLKRRWCRDLDT